MLPGNQFGPPPFVKMTLFPLTEYLVPVAAPENVMRFARIDATFVLNAKADVNAGVPLTVTVIRLTFLIVPPLLAIKCVLAPPETK